MMKKIIVIFCWMFSLVCATSGCKKDENASLGRYSVAINYVVSPTAAPLPLDIFIDGIKYGEILPLPNVTPSYAVNCDDLDNPADLTNVFVIQGITKGKHNIELKSKSGEVVKTLKFEMENTECVFQDLDLIYN